MRERLAPVWTVMWSILGFGLLVLAGSTGIVRKSVSAPGDGIELALRLLALSLAVGLGVAVFVRLRNALKEGKPASSKAASQPSMSWLQSLQRSAGRTIGDQLDENAVWTFVLLIVDPARYRSRVAETVTLEERMITQHVSVEFTFPRTGKTDTPRYVPLLTPIKGQLIDGFKLSDSSGKSLVDLSFEETTELVAAGLRVLLLNALELDFPAASPESELSPPQVRFSGVDDEVVADKVASLRDLELHLLSQIARRGTVTADDASASIAAALDLASDRLTPQGSDQIRRYALSLSVSYPIVAVVPKEAVVSDRALLRYERLLVPTALSKGLRGFARVFFGIKPYQIALPLDLALTARSYHMRLNGPPNKYVLGQRFRCRECDSDVDRSWEPVKERDEISKCFHRAMDQSDVPQFSETDRYYRIRPRRGQSFVHLYMRGFGDQRKLHFRNLDLFAQFKEVPPGSRAAAVVTALACTVLVWIIGRLTSTMSNSPPATLPALMLALPAAASSWSGVSPDSSLVGSSLLARISQMVTAVVSFTAISVYFTSHNGRIWHNIAIVGINEPLWALLLLVSSANLLFVSYRFALKLVHYNSLLRKKERPTNEGALW